MGCAPSAHAAEAVEPHDRAVIETQLPQKTGSVKGAGTGGLGGQKDDDMGQRRKQAQARGSFRTRDLALESLGPQVSFWKRFWRAGLRGRHFLPHVHDGQRAEPCVLATSSQAKAPCSPSAT